MCEEHVFLVDMKQIIKELRNYLESFENYWVIFEKVI